MPLLPLILWARLLGYSWFHFAPYYGVLFSGSWVELHIGCNSTFLSYCNLRFHHLNSQNWDISIRYNRWSPINELKYRSVDSEELLRESLSLGTFLSVFSGTKIRVIQTRPMWLSRWWTWRGRESAWLSEDTYSFLIHYEKILCLPHLSMSSYNREKLKNACVCRNTSESASNPALQL